MERYQHLIKYRAVLGIPIGLTLLLPAIISVSVNYGSPPNSSQK